MSERLNTLRAGVLGSNDGILTVVGVLFSVAVATTDQFTIFIAGLSDLLACAFSMAAGEYASVSTQKDAEKAAVAKEKQLLKTDFSSELATVKMFYVERGVSEQTAALIAQDLMAKKPLETIISIKYNLNLGQYMNPWNAALSSFGLISNWFIIANACDHVVSRKDQDHSNIYRGFDRFSLDWLRGSYFK